MKSTYLTGYFPLISITLFSLSFAIYMQGKLINIFQSMGLYSGLLEFFSETGIRLTLLFVLSIVFFMMFAALKLIADTIVQISLLLFSKERIGESLKSLHIGSSIYLVGSGVSIFLHKSLIAIILALFITTMMVFIYFIYKASAHLSSFGLMGVVFLHVFTWSCLLTSVGYAVLKLYNSLLASLPI